ncbi:MAG: response regulator [Anaerolineae bacterium]|nr:response regulator [Anaerolineae bacterium]MDX9832739.1 response regulator [Anaerolineae bacterium]
MVGSVLVADDEAHIRLLIEQALEDLEDRGVVILMAEHGIQALEMIRAQKPRLAFLDIMMPRMNGYEVCRAVRDDLGLQDVYLVLLTAKGQTADRQLGEQSGADLYLTKPFDPDELLEIAEMVLGAESWPS